MSRTFSVATVVGSLRQGSLNRKMARNLAAAAPETLRFDEVPIGDLPLYNQELDDDPPAAWAAFRDRVRPADGVLFVTPEYNRSVPGVLKNAIDVGSRPYGHSVWAGKPAAVVSLSPGALGGFGANHHLRQSLVFLDMPVMQQPEAYFGSAGTYLDEDGAITNAKTAEMVKRFIHAFADWVALFAGRGP